MNMKQFRIKPEKIAIVASQDPGKSSRVPALANLENLFECRARAAETVHADAPNRRANHALGQGTV